MLAEWGTTLTAGNATAVPCIKTPTRKARDMMQSGYLFKAQSTFDMWRADWTSLGLDGRKQFTCEGGTYEVFPFNDDGTEPTIQFTAERVK